ncbi:ABC transporter permease [Humibacter albus]|uniref:ABC transporter permease n=1 Tax=Humibacter albus TaxID=427754 RepID=UPI0003B30B13|nr:ABC transporter permease [Humibacter albus]
MSIAYLGLESVRQLKNVRSTVFTFAVPLVMLLLFGGIYGSSGQIDKVTGLPWIVVTTVQMAGYGGMMAALGQAFTIVTERSVGWNRQLRLTPLTGVGYLMSKVVAALAVALASIIALMVISVIVFHASLSFGGWALAALGLWLGVIPFALIAVLIGQFAKPQFAQPLFMVVFLGMAILGGLWVPLSVLPDWMTNIAQVVPSYWLNRLGQMGAGMGGDILEPVLVLLGWTLVLGAFITWRYRRDAARQ